MLNKNSLLILGISLFFIACGEQSSSSTNSKVEQEVVKENKVLNDNTNAAFNLPKVKNSEELPVNNLQTLK